MLWARVSYADRTLFGSVIDGGLHVHAGDMFTEANPTGEVVPLCEARWLTPCCPTKFIALWNNYHQAALKNGHGIPNEPLYFARTANSFNGHLGAIEVPAGYNGRVVYEGELGIVIGKRCRRVSPSDARAGIFGYTCVNDVTGVELIGRDRSFAQWTRAKNFDGFGVFGPVIATDVEPNPLTIRTIVNGRERQNYPTGDMIFKPPELVSLISQDMTLEPGDLIACGTSLGVSPMRPGTEVEVAIDGIGVLRNVYG